MPRSTKTSTNLFALAEQRAKDTHVGANRPTLDLTQGMQCLMNQKSMDRELAKLKKLEVDDYIARVLEPAESTSLSSAKAAVRMINGKIFNEVDMGPLYAVELLMESPQGKKRVGIIAQNRGVKNGVWGPEHHLEAARLARIFNHRNIPIVTFMDTPGADAGAEANTNNQAHSISRLIAEMTNIQVPTIGIIYGLGYSGGAIPLAATNLLLSVRTGVFNTIQPKGLASIARQYNLSWQESARYVGISPVELKSRGVIDGIIDWAPTDMSSGITPLVDAIVSGIKAIEQASKRVVAEEPELLADYEESLQRFLKGNETLEKLQKVSGFQVESSITEYPNPFLYACRYLRYVTLRGRISSSTIDAYGRLAQDEIPTGDLAERQQKAREEAFKSWHKDPEKLVYQDDLFKAWKSFKEKRADLSTDRGRFTTILLGDPQKNFEDALQQLCFRVTLYLYNRWKADSQYNFVRLAELLEAESDDAATAKTLSKSDNDLTISDLLHSKELKSTFLVQFQNILIFDLLYDNIVNNFDDIAAETREFHTLSGESIKKILDNAIEQATARVSNDGASGVSAGQFAQWLNYFVKYRRRGEFLKDVEEWKRVSFPRLSESLLVLITFFFENLVPEYLNSQLYGKTYEGRINPVRIGKRKDFWNQLNIAYRDLLVQKTLTTYKRKKASTVEAFKKTFFTNFEETDADMMTADPVSFPGFRISIEKALKAEVTPCGVITGIGKLKGVEGNPKVGVVISNVAFQAGAFDMASAEKMCDLMLECAQRKLPIVCFVSSGGMQTKEGANALFSMAIVNDRITRFIMETGLPVVVFGFGDCTGGSQASFVTHPLVQTYYFSGTDLPFAGRVVVPSFLPSMCTVSNYLVKTSGAMAGLVKHPFAEGMDEELSSIDPELVIPSRTVDEVLAERLEGRIADNGGMEPEKPVTARELLGPIEKVLIHARGCTAVKLIRIAQQLEKKVLLVQSDPDIDSAAADMMREGVDEVVSLGGQTPDESYLNAHSVLAIGSRHGADSLHPGIGFLSENAGFARLCRKYRLNFIGPKAQSMDVMGNKSNAINTAMVNNVPVVPGSHGILTTANAAAKVGDEIGYPVLLKAVHGGGGKGIQIVRESSEIKEAFSRVFSEAKSAFGNGDLYLEKFVESMRHIEVQVLRDSHGNTKILGVRDCTVQRNNQKVIEESGSTMLLKKLEKEVSKCAADLADAVDYIGAGTVEFIYDLDNKACYFMEMNTRLQVEHPVTEWTSGVSIVSQQFRIAEGESIKDLKVENKGFSIEARITAEKARVNSRGEFDFIPTPGLVSECTFPERDDIEVICAVAEGKTISPFYDSMIAQLVVYGEDRNDAIAKLLEVLDDTSIKGVCTNIPLLKTILKDEVFIKGVYDTNYLPKLLGRIDKDALVEEMAYAGVDTSDSHVDTLRIEGTDELKVIAPMTGIFYTTPSPNDPEYVKVGSRINVSATICQIEAMKLFSQISLSSCHGAGEVFEAGKTYEVVRVNQGGGAQVNTGDLLFVVKPV
jgi:acetyl/propionyl-CoA carboxylase alpha subunit/acetyl-CoA carboxylase beta subunit